MNQPAIVTPRLELSPPSAGDRAALHAIVSHPETGRFLGPREEASGHFQRFARNAGSWWLYGYGAFVTRLRATGEVIGNCGVFHSLRGLGDDFDDKPEAGWILRHDMVGQGLGFEAMQAALAWFEREHGTQTITCMIEPGNRASFNLASRLRFEALREAALPDGAPVVLLTRPAGLSRKA